MTKSQITPFPLRLAPELREKLEDVARREGRSLQVEIALRLERSLNADKPELPVGDEILPSQKIKINNLADIIAARVEERMRARNEAVHGTPAAIPKSTRKPKA